MFNVAPLMECIFLNLYDLLECIVMEKTLILIIKVKLQNFLKQGYRYPELVSKINVGLKSLLHQSLSESEFYCDLGIHKDYG